MATWSIENNNTHTTWWGLQLFYGYCSWLTVCDYVATQPSQLNCDSKLGTATSPSPPHTSGLPRTLAQPLAGPSSHLSHPINVLSSNLWRKRTFKKSCRKLSSVKHRTLQFSGPYTIEAMAKATTRKSPCPIKDEKAMCPIMWEAFSLSFSLANHRKCLPTKIISHRNRASPSGVGFWRVCECWESGTSALTWIFQTLVLAECVRVKKLCFFDCLSGNIFSSLFHC